VVMPAAILPPKALARTKLALPSKPPSTPSAGRPSGSREGALRRLVDPFQKKSGLPPLFDALVLANADRGRYLPLLQRHRSAPPPRGDGAVGWATNHLSAISLLEFQAPA